MFKTTLTMTYQMCNFLDDVASELRHFDFSKIVPLPENSDKMMDGFTDESIYYYLTNRLEVPFSPVDHKLYIESMIPTKSTAVVSIETLEAHTKNLVKYLDQSKSTESLYLSGEAIVNMANRYGLTLLSLWRFEYWGQYLNTLESKRLDRRTVEFYTNDHPSIILDKFASKFLLSPKTDFEATIETVAFNL